MGTSSGSSAAGVDSRGVSDASGAGGGIVVSFARRLAMRTSFIAFINMEFEIKGCEVGTEPDEVEGEMVFP